MLAGLLGACEFPARHQHAVRTHEITQVLAGASKCKPCQLYLDSVTTIPARLEDIGGPAPFSHLSVGADGRYYLAPTAEPGTVEVYDSAGRRVHRIGRPGRGPGELVTPQAATRLSDGRIVVVDAGSNAPVSYFDSLGAFLGAVRYDAGIVHGVEVTRWGAVVNAPRMRRGHLSPGLVIDGDSLVEVMLALPVDADDRTVYSTRLTLHQGDVWIAVDNGRTLVAASRGGDVLQRYPRTEMPKDPSYVIGLTTLSDYIVILTVIEDPGFRPPADWPVSRRLSTRLAGAKLDSRIDIVDPADGALVFAGRLESPIIGSPHRGMVVIEREGEDGSLQLGVWRLRLTTSPGNDQ